MSSLKLLAKAVAKPGKEKETRDALQAMVQPSRLEPGCIRYDLFQVRDNAGEFWFIEEWSSEAALEHHRKTGHYLRLHEVAPTLTQSVQAILLEPVE